jgi:hypothetical protein
MNATSIQITNTVDADLCDHFWLDCSDYIKLKIKSTVWMNVKMPNGLFQTDNDHLLYVIKMAHYQITVSAMLSFS